MKCPACKGTDLRVADVRERGDSLTKRIKKCRSCGKRFKTWEEIEGSTTPSVEVPAKP